VGKLVISSVPTVKISNGKGGKMGNPRSVHVGPPKTTNKTVPVRVPSSVSKKRSISPSPLSFSIPLLPLMQLEREREVDSVAFLMREKAEAK
jgi:hypothetical protein